MARGRLSRRCILRALPVPRVRHDAAQTPDARHCHSPSRVMAVGLYGLSCFHRIGCRDCRPFGGRATYDPRPPAVGRPDKAAVQGRTSRRSGGDTLI